jgi:hypothetical protein
MLATSSFRILTFCDFPSIHDKESKQGSIPLPYDSSRATVEEHIFSNPLHKAITGAMTGSLAVWLAPVAAPGAPTGRRCVCLVAQPACVASTIPLWRRSYLDTPDETARPGRLLASKATTVCFDVAVEIFKNSQSDPLSPSLIFVGQLMSYSPTV